MAGSVGRRSLLPGQRARPGAGRVRINESFLRGGWDDRFATLVVAVLDPASHAVTICNAGHLPVFLRDPAATVRQVAADLGGLPLGMVRRP